jgi:hypothetical protein
LKHLILITIVSVFFCCKSTKTDYPIEKKPTPILTNGYYTSWVSGIKGGGAGYSVFLFFKENSTVNYKGIYFKNRYGKIRSQGNNKYQANIKSNQNREQNSFDGESETEKSEKTVIEKIPFELLKNEAIISYVENEELKFMKIVLTKKENEELPM